MVMDRVEAEDVEDHRLEDLRRSKTSHMKSATLSQQAQGREDI